MVQMTRRHVADGSRYMWYAETDSVVAEGPGPLDAVGAVIRAAAPVRQ